jgi:hypothetical protein
MKNRRSPFDLEADDAAGQVEERLVGVGAALVADQQATEEAEPLVTALEAVAEVVEGGLQVRGADAREDLESPALEVGG